MLRDMQSTVGEGIPDSWKHLLTYFHVLKQIWANSTITANSRDIWLPFSPSLSLCCFLCCSLCLYLCLHHLPSHSIIINICAFLPTLCFHIFSSLKTVYNVYTSLFTHVYLKFVNVLCLCTSCKSLCNWSIVDMCLYKRYEIVILDVTSLEYLKPFTISTLTGH